MGRERIAESVTPFVAVGGESPIENRPGTSTRKYVEEKGEEKGEEEEGSHNNNQVQGWEEKMEEEELEIGSSEKTDGN